MDELIRAIGMEAVEAVVAAKGDVESFRRFQKRPAQRGRFVHVELHRFLRTRCGRKLWYAEVLAEAVSPERVSPPLTGVLDTVDGG